VFAGTGTPAVGAKRIVWQGDLAAGEVRRLDVAFASPNDATPVWAEAQIASQPGYIVRSIATLQGSEEGANAPRTLHDAGQLVRDPRTGESFYEFPGQVGR
jgi:hypothetical protein